MHNVAVLPSAPPATPKTSTPAHASTHAITLSQDYLRLLETLREAPDVPRFIRAPEGFGKSTLAHNYAARYYHSKDVLWLDGASQSFKEGLQSGALLGYVGRFAKDGENTRPLLVIDDLMHLDEHASEHFSECLDLLVEHNWEVLIVVDPLHDCYQDLQSDRLLIDGAQLLRVQEMTEERVHLCLRAFFAGALPDELKVLGALVLLTQQASIDDLRQLGYAIKDDAPALLHSFCPLFALDAQSGAFHLPHARLEGLKEQVSGVLGAADLLCDEPDISVLERVFKQLTRLAVFLFDRREAARSRQLLDFAGEIIRQAKQDAVHFASLEAFENACVMGIDRDKEWLASHGRGGRGEQSAWGSEQSAWGDVPRGKVELLFDSSVEPLYFKLFGTLEVYRGGVRLDDAQLRRSKVRTLLVYLVLNNGRGIARETLMRHLWPEMDELRATDNFYVTWSRLSRLLGGSGGKCVYVSGKSQLCKLDTRYVKSDVGQFDELSKAVMFGQGSLEERMEAFYQMERLYRDDILAGALMDAYTEAYQKKYRTMLVDALLQATRMFSQAGNDSNALWFARKAYDTDPTREDVYRILMDAQMQAGQRTSALKTYFECKQFLIDELGILPSSKTNALYQDLILDKQWA